MFVSNNKYIRNNFINSLKAITIKKVIIFSNLNMKQNINQLYITAVQFGLIVDSLKFIMW